MRSSGPMGLVELLAQTLSGKRLVWLAGNHDHHILVRRLEALTELRIATGKPDHELSEEWRASFFFEAFLRRSVRGARTLAFGVQGPDPIRQGSRAASLASYALPRRID
jgi:hypothetical protein